jgi:chromosome segregation ATPase
VQDDTNQEVIDELRDKIEEIKTSVSTLQETNGTMAGDLRDRDLTIKNLEGELGAKEKELSKVKTGLTQSEKTIAALKEENQKIRIQIEVMQKELTSLQDGVNKNDESKGGIQVELGIRIEEIKKLKISISKLSAELAASDGDCNSLRAQNLSLQKDLTKQREIVINSEQVIRQLKELLAGRKTEAGERVKVYQAEGEKAVERDQAEPVKPSDPKVFR